MKILTWSLVAVLLSVLATRGDEPPVKESEAGRLRTTEAYYRKAGKPTAADYYRALADRLEEPKAARVPTIYVPILKSNGLSRQDALMLTELVIKSIDRESKYRVVGSPDEADLIFQGDLTPGKRVKP